MNEIFATSMYFGGKDVNRQSLLLTEIHTAVNENYEIKIIDNLKKPQTLNL